MLASPLPAMRPPFRADQVGSLLRPPNLKADPKAAIREVVAKQEAIGLESVTDGEFSRQWWRPHEYVLPRQGRSPQRGVETGRPVERGNKIIGVEYDSQHFGGWLGTHHIRERCHGRT